MKLIVLLLLLTGCSMEARIESSNLSKMTVIVPTDNGEDIKYENISNFKFSEYNGHFYENLCTFEYNNKHILISGNFVVESSEPIGD